MLRSALTGLALALALVTGSADAQTPASTQKVTTLPIVLGVNGQTDYAIGSVLQVINGLPLYVASRVPIAKLQGPAGLAATFTSISVATLAPGSAATATLGGTAPNYTLTLGIPQGQPGTGTGNVNTTGTPAAGQIAYYPTTSPNSIAPLVTAIPISLGGTGGSSAASARSGLGAAASGSNSDITSLSGLSTPLSVGQGGTGATSASGARTSLGAAASGANTDITSLAGPAIGAATATTQAASDSSTKVATTAQVQAAIAAIPPVSAGSGAPSAANAISAAYTVQASDKGKTLLLSGSFTVTEPACSANAGLYFWVKKADGAGDVVLQPASGTTDGLASKHVYQESFLEWCDGTNWRSQDRPKGWVDVGTSTVGSPVAAVDFTIGFGDVELRDVEVVFDNFALAASEYPEVLFLRSGSPITSGYTGTGYYFNGSGNNALAPANFNGVPLANATASPTTGRFTAFNIAATAFAQRLRVESSTPSAPTLAIVEGSVSTTGVLSGLRVKSFSSSNVSTGTFSERVFRP